MAPYPHAPSKHPILKHLAAIHPIIRNLEDVLVGTCALAVELDYYASATSRRGVRAFS